MSIENAINDVVIGQSNVIRLINIALFARGHVLLEGDVGVGKTTVLRAFAAAIGGEFERVEGTIDLMPNDLVYHTYVDEKGHPCIDPGPLLRHGNELTTFFFNEINRARPQVQSLLLRAMAERTLSAFNREHEFPHMLVFADRNKVEKEETFELAGAARDRFMFEIMMATPSDTATRLALLADPRFHDTDSLLSRIPTGICKGHQLNRVGAAIQTLVKASETLEQYVIDLWAATENPARFGITLEGVDIDQLILSGASPRGMSALMRASRVAAWIAGRDYLTPEDIHAVLPQVLGHRLFFNPLYEMRRADITPRLMTELMNRVAAP